MRWNCKSFIDRMLGEAWSNTADTALITKLINWSNEIQDELISLLPVEEMKFQLKKLLPVSQEYCSLSLQKPSVPTVALASGGSLVDSTTYKVYVTFVVYDSDTRKYMESVASEASAVASPTGANLSIDVSAIDLFDGDTSYTPTTIYRNVYLSKKASGATAYGDPLFISQIADNTTTTLSITAESSSTITPPGADEIDQITSEHPFFPSNGAVLRRLDADRLRMFDVSSSESSEPTHYDFDGLSGIRLYPKLSSGASTAQRTIKYSVYRRPHEFFYDATRPIDLPIICENALVKGVLWKIYEYRDRAGKESKQINYEAEKESLKRKLGRQRGSASVIRDVSGDYAGFEV